ncbi:MAG TPA: carbohydrate-binding family V/XII, partial [Candidatus Kapabacteria bacterium]
MRHYISLLLFAALLCVGSSVQAQDASWPRVVTTSDGATVTLYQPTPESFVGDKLKMRTAVSIKLKSTDAPKFGAIWAEAKMQTDRTTRMVTLESITITDVKFPGENDQAKITKFKALLETEIPKWDYPISLDKLLASVEEENKIQDANLKNDPPIIYYRKEPTLLVNFDGAPRVQKDEQMNMERVVNTPILIIKAPEDSKFYLYSGLWYMASDVKGTWSQASKLPSSIESISKQVKEQELKTQKENGATPPAATPSKIITSEKPAELIQSKGEAKFTAIDKTKLLYMSNSDDDIFMEITSQKYYILLSGRWYSSDKLEGPWSFVAADKLPSDFAMIPEGSAKDGILASVAGTSAAREAVMDAQVPQTAAIDIATAKCTVSYDGEPKFEKIDGTSLELAMNTSSTVMRTGQTYYALDKGIWFKSASAKGPWAVADKRPEDVDNIPPSSSAYNAKYAYIYEVTPTTVYVGYTPGYTGTYVYGPTVVYGTGYYYYPWYGAYYYPRPYTYGYGMAYNPYYGWGMHVAFHIGFH